jgi:hypothetical protein
MATHKLSSYKMHKAVFYARWQEAIAKRAQNAPCRFRECSLHGQIGNDQGLTGAVASAGTCPDLAAPSEGSSVEEVGIF